MLETNKQVSIFKFGEDLSYFLIRRSSIEHGGTRPFFHYVVFFMDFSFYYILVFYEGFPRLGVGDHFSIWWINILATIR